jgi:hypothetical protein
MTVFRAALVLALTLAASSVSAQTLGTFRWRTAPYCNVMNVTVTQVGSVYRLEGFEEQCGGNPHQPIWGIGVVQPNGSITLGLSVVALPGPPNPWTIRASLGSDFNGAWTDNDTSSGTMEFNPPPCTVGCGGPRTPPVNYDRATPAATTDASSDLRAELERLKQAVAALAVRKDD